MSIWRDVADLEATALIVIDMQNDFCDDNGAQAINGLDVSGSQRIVPILSNLVEEARRQAVPLYFIRTTHDPTTDSPAWTALHDYWARPVCETGTWGAEFYGFSPKLDDITITKHRYSAFVGTDLELRLRSTQRRVLFITGVTTNVCVESTVRDAYMRNFFPILVEDCTAAATKAAHDAALQTIRSNFGWVAGSDEMISWWPETGMPIQAGIRQDQRIPAEQSPVIGSRAFRERRG